MIKEIELKTPGGCVFTEDFRGTGDSDYTRLSFKSKSDMHMYVSTQQLGGWFSWLMSIIDLAEGTIEMLGQFLKPLEEDAFSEVLVEVVDTAAITRRNL